MSAWRPLLATDLPGLEALAALVHPNYPEPAEVPESKLALFPEGCLGWREAPGAPLQGYALSHPWHEGDLPPLGHVAKALPAAPALLVIHDLALHPAVQGRGLAAEAVALLRTVARRHALPRLRLVAVNGAEGFWQRQGFAAVPDRAAQARIRAAFAEEALLMDSHT